MSRREPPLRYLLTTPSFIKAWGADGLWKARDVRSRPREKQCVELPQTSSVSASPVLFGVWFYWYDKSLESLQSTSLGADLTAI